MNQEKAIGTVGSLSGIAGILGSWQVCHSVCLGIIALLSIIGITVAGMHLLFLTKLAIPFWTVALLLLLVVILISARKKCVSKNLILFNSGLIIAGVPFEKAQSVSLLLWVVGGLISLASIALFVRDKFRKKVGA